ncbi:carbon-nitrogen hydrolase family protein [Fodinicola acaciae]|uniref:carbon-nitrogen hydrolase family protein n=1 Tax=Fodinicola acaciae TaxID=2681555 RepID=UPI0013D06A56|nr:carbon-nitrogen hydrolase family protein [Fodinicola acaciae]
MPLIRLSLVQQHCQKARFADNLASTAKFAAGTDADIVCFPEMSLTGYLDPAVHADSVLDLDSAQVRQFCALSAGRTLIAGIVEHNSAGKPFITQIVATDGKLAGVYRKINVAPDEEDAFAAGSERPVFEAAGVRFGIAVCYDVGHGDLFDAYGQAGAELVLLAAAPGLTASRKAATGAPVSSGGAVNAGNTSRIPPSGTESGSAWRPSPGVPSTRTSPAAVTCSRRTARSSRKPPTTPSRF